MPILGILLSSEKLFFTSFLAVRVTGSQPTICPSRLALHTVVCLCKSDISSEEDKLCTNSFKRVKLDMELMMFAKKTPNHRRSVNLNPAILGDKRMVSSQAGWFIRPDPTTVSEALHCKPPSNPLPPSEMLVYRFGSTHSPFILRGWERHSNSERIILLKHALRDKINLPLTIFSFDHVW